MAEMSGPYDPEASYCWASSSNYQGYETLARGQNRKEKINYFNRTFPVSWIVSKDVSFYQVAQKLRACGLDSSQVRIKNGYRYVNPSMLSLYMIDQTFLPLDFRILKAGAMCRQ